MKRVLPLPLLLALLCFAGAQDLNFPLERYLFTGTLEGRTVQLDLSLTQGSKATGTLALDGRERTLTGTADEEGNLTLRTPNGILRLEGTLPTPWSDAPTTLSGTLREDGGVTPFSLQKAAEYATQRVRQGTFLEAESTYPFFTAAPWQQINREVQEGARRPLERFVREGQALVTAGELNHFWTRYETLELKRLTLRTLSLLGTVSVYTGGAHPNTHFRALNFVREGGTVRRLALGDLFKPGTPFVRVLSEYVLADLREQEAAWVADGSIPALRAEELGAFTLSGRGLEFAFAPYAVGPYAQGAFVVTVPYARLAGMLRPRFLP